LIFRERSQPSGAVPSLHLLARLGVIAVAIGAAHSGHAETPAFPGAEGAGRLTSGGRGGTVVHVTTLDRDGPGSLAEAVSGPDRIVVFDVSGIIDLAHKGKAGHVRVAHPNITIAGQTAPGEGICLRGGSLDILAPNVMVRHLRSRRGFIADGDSGDAIMVKPKASGEKLAATGTSAAEFEQTRIKKIERGKTLQAYSDIDNIVIDHCSTSWATDENLTVTHAGLATISYCIAAEGLDYANPRQTPPNHAEGGLWGSAAPDGRSTMHHMLFAHNRLRNPRTTAGADVPPVLTLYNNVVYNWSEYPTHTGSERVLLQWVNNTYVPGPDTPAAGRGIGFEFHGDPGARVFARGNVIAGSPAASADNRLAVGYGRKFRSISAEQRALMMVDQPFAELPARLQPADEAYATVLAESGATLPARDSVDRRIVESVRARSGRVILKETDLPAGERWPDYRSLPAPADRDRDGIPDFWERQFGLNPDDAADSAALSVSGYANIEHYFNNTDPRRNAKDIEGGTGGAIVFVGATISRANVAASRPGQWRIGRTGNAQTALTVRYRLSGDAIAKEDFAALSGEITIPAGKSSVVLPLVPTQGARDGRMVVLTLDTGEGGYYVGCPSQSLVVIQR
jgi:large repetitive protein